MTWYGYVPQSLICLVEKGTNKWRKIKLYAKEKDDRRPHTVSADFDDL